MFVLLLLPLSLHLFTPGIESLECNGTQRQGDSNAGREQSCQGETSVCYAYWTLHPLWPHNTSLYTMLAGGCMNSSQSHCDTPTCSASVRAGDRLSKPVFCCCSHDHCNGKPFIRPYQLSDDLVTVSGMNPNASVSVFLIPLAISLFLIIVIVIIMCFVTVVEPRRAKKTSCKAKAGDAMCLLEPRCTPSQPAVALDELTLTQLVARGKFASVWKWHTPTTSVVAVKLFCSEHENVFLNECGIYSLPLMSHPSLAQWHGCGERRGLEGSLQYCLVLEYAPNGTLCDYLHQHELDWLELCRLIGSLVAGVAHLHTELAGGGTRKPAIVHRNLCAKNVMVKADGSCMIIDFQHAFQFGDHQHASQGDSSWMVDTNLAYRAPELLEEGASATRSEAWLKQVDVYALAMIMWEIATRCSDLYQGIEVPAYRAPFQAEVGADASYDQMRVLVVRHKARPLLPEIWKDSNHAIRLLKETIAECWDHEPEARLTALCIEQRMHELASLWRQSKKDMVTCVLADAGQHKLGDCYINRFENSVHSNDHHHLLHHHHRHHRAEKDTWNVNLEKNLQNQSSKLNGESRLKHPLQPYQARNPCMERNLYLDTIDETEALLEQGFKFHNILEKSSNLRAEGEDTPEASEPRPSEEPRPTTRAALPTPIAYVHNVVGNTGSRQKDTNQYSNLSTQPEDTLSYRLKLFNIIRNKMNQLGQRKNTQDVEQQQSVECTPSRACKHANVLDNADHRASDAAPPPSALLISPNCDSHPVFPFTQPNNNTRLGLAVAGKLEHQAEQQHLLAQP